MTELRTMTTSAGNPIGDNQNSLSAGERGPLLMQDYQLIEKLAHQNRERIPERVVHAKGWGAFGSLTITNDISKYTKARLFSEVGKRTELLARFSTVAGELGAADAERDVRGFALKFYTEEGNWDLVGNNTPVFFVRDPVKFPDFIHISTVMVRIPIVLLMPKISACGSSFILKRDRATNIGRMLKPRRS